MDTTQELEIKRIVSMSNTAAIVLAALYDRNRNRSTSDLGRLRTWLVKAGRGVPWSELMQVFQALEKAKIGRIVHTKNKAPSFEWTVALKDVGLAAKSSAPVQKRPVDPVVRTILSSTTLSDDQKIKMLREYFDGG